MDDLRTVGALHQDEGGVSCFLLIGLLADLTHCGQREARLEWTDRRKDGGSRIRLVHSLEGQESIRKHSQRDTVSAHRSA